ncbi:ribonuclease H-like domain-containing protein [Sordaria brevicollis]|uniref:Ribonuclease H-like domain-containing protein n=1 Tax=Sordaria brevicollis TaxID=83679 RepID=A0AAE0PI83_SORBR|nr:ribonuclease H-like domain-containing protein [Sordaria brevicollis]
MDGSLDFKTFRESLQAALVATTRTANSIASEDLQFQRTVNPSVGSQLDNSSGRLLSLANGLLKSSANLTGQKVSALEDADDVDIQWRNIVDVIDSLLEKADTCLDEYTGLIKRKDAPTAADQGRAQKRVKSSNDRLDWSLKRANILKPQNNFERKVDNFATGPWKPLLSSKPHAKVSLEDSLTTFVDEYDNTQYKHPYETEIKTTPYPDHVYEKREPKEYLPIDQTSAIWVDTYEGVLEMLEELKQAKEIALDLEHHDFRTYTGLLSLMQISTREKDWVIDTLQPWRHKLEVLNEVFADPKIVKVLHGAFMDAIWLQRDLGLYLVGLFDTYHACAVLGYPGRSLGYLLSKFADFEADKKYQLADWRIRPLPEEMFYYARSDTHYLLYIYDMLVNELIERSKPGNHKPDQLELVLERSRDVALQRYENPSYNVETGQGPRGWYNVLLKSPTLYNSEQFAVYKAVHKWRDDLARREDESPFFFMTQQVLADIARILPTDKKALWSILDSNAKGLKPHLDNLFDVIQKAKEEGVNGPKMMDIFKSDSSTIAPAKIAAVISDDSDIPDVKELKADRSQFWGGVTLSSVWDGTAAKTAKLDGMLEINLPYPADFMDGTATEMEVDQPEEPTPAPQPEPEQVVVAQEFTLRAGGKRKREEESEEEEEEEASDAEMDDTSAPQTETDAQQTGGDNSDSDDSESEETSDKSSSKESKKAAKKAAKEKKKQEKEALRAQRRAEKAAKKEAKKKAQEEAAKAKEGGEEQEDKPFDYSQAASVLRARKTQEDVKKASKRFNPYGNKGDDGPKAARAHYSAKAAGRTATFKK